MKSNTMLFFESMTTSLNESSNKSMLDSKSNNTLVAKNQYNYNVLGIIIDDDNKQFQVVSGQYLPINKYKTVSKKAIYNKREELLSKGYTEYFGYGSIQSLKKGKEEINNEN